jgi:hypothetical protein
MPLPVSRGIDGIQGLNAKSASHRQETGQEKRQVCEAALIHFNARHIFEQDEVQTEI